MWTYYGIIKPGEILVATVNGFGVVVEAAYVTLFLIYAPAKMRVTSSEFSPSHFVAYRLLPWLICYELQAKTVALVSLLDVGFLAAAILVTRLALQGDTRIDALGFICSGLNIVMYGSPLAAMVRITACSSSIFAVTEIFLW